MRRDVFQAIADPIRRDILSLLADTPLTVNNVAEKFDVSRPAVSKHLKILQECDLITVERNGRARMCMIKPQNLMPAFMWIEQYKKLWENRLDEFGDYLHELQTKTTSNEPKK